jgi:Mg-chelatase subunit ChlD
MRRSRLGWPAWVLAGIVLIAFVTFLPLGFVAQQPARTGALAAPTPTQSMSSCVAELQKSADPTTLSLGGQTQASLAISITCAARMKPVDLVFVADESNSMTKQLGDGGTSEPGIPMDTPDPLEPTETPGPGGGGGTPGSGLGDEPAWCAILEGGGSIPSITPTPRRPPRRTPTPVDRIETAVPEPAGADDLLRDVKEFVGDFMDQDVIKRDMTSDRLHVGFVSFNEKAVVKQALTDQASKITSAAGRMRGGNVTRINQGVKEAERVLDGTGSRVDLGKDGREQIVILLSDFRFCQRDVRSGGKFRKEADVITIGVGRDYNKKLWVEYTTDRQLALQPKDLKEVVHLYENVFAPLIPVTVKDLKAHDELAGNMGLIPGSVQPPTVTITGQLLEWQLDPLKLPWQLGYTVQPAEAGTHPLSVAAGIDWTDSEGAVGSAMFPSVDLEIIPDTATPTPTATATVIPSDTPTPTATATATATATRTPGPDYLPILYHNWPEPLPTQCVPEQQTIDTALVIDTSNSMADPTQPGGISKLLAAVGAAQEIVNLLKPGDQATIIAFNNKAYLLSQLSGDKTQLTAALQALPGTQAQGTSIDLGLQAGLDELQSARHRAGNSRSIILVTDGAQTVGEEQKVRDVAAKIDAAGIKIVTVGLGPDVDITLLQEIASEPRLFFRSPTTEGLTQIYREIARLIPCP